MKAANQVFDRFLSPGFCYKTFVGARATLVYLMLLYIVPRATFIEKPGGANLVVLQEGLSHARLRGVSLLLEKARAGMAIIPALK